MIELTNEVEGEGYDAVKPRKQANHPLQEHNISIYTTVHVYAGHSLLGVQYYGCMVRD